MCQESYVICTWVPWKHCLFPSIWYWKTWCTLAAELACNPQNGNFVFADFSCSLYGDDGTTTYRKNYSISRWQEHKMHGSEKRGERLKRSHSSEELPQSTKYFYFLCTFSASQVSHQDLLMFRNLQVSEQKIYWCVFPCLFSLLNTWVTSICLHASGLKKYWWRNCQKF